MTYGVYKNGLLDRIQAMPISPDTAALVAVGLFIADQLHEANEQNRDVSAGNPVPACKSCGYSMREHIEEIVGPYIHSRLPWKAAACEGRNR